MHRKTLVSLAAVALCATAVVASGQESPTRVVAEDGDRLKGETITVTGTADALGIAETGAVLFDGRTAVGKAYFLDDSGSLSVVLQEFGPAPSPPAGFTLSGIDRVLLESSGNVAAQAFLAGPPQTESLLTSIAGVAAFTATAPGALAGTTGLVDLQSGSWSFHGETFAFLGSEEFPGVGRRRALYRRVGTGAAEPLVRDLSDLPGVPGARAAGFDFRPPAVSRAGAVVGIFNYDAGASRALVAFAAPGAAAAPVALTTAGPGESLGEYTLGDTPAGSDVPRVVYARNSLSGQEIFDTAVSGGPVMRTGTTSGDRTLDLVATRKTGVAACAGGHVVVVGRTAGLGVVGGTNADGVWRHVPEEPVVCELWEGQTLPDLDGNPLTLSKIYSVHVNTAGRVAVEVSIGGIDAIAIQAEPGGDYRVVAQQRKTFDADGTDYEVTAIVGLNPSQFAFTGPGLDGRQSRFAADGSFVFRAFVDTVADPADRNAVFVVQGTPRDDSNITAKVRGRHLVVTGEDRDSQLTIEVLDGGDYLLRPGVDTTVNGKRSELEISATGDLRVALRGGRDRLDIVSAYGGEQYAELPSNAVVDMGAGNDSLVMNSLGVARSLKVRMGKDAVGPERVLLDSVDVGKHLQLDCGPADVDCELDRVVVSFKTKIQHGGNGGRVRVDNCQLLGKAQFVGASNSDSFTFESCQFEGVCSVDLRDGIGGSAKFSDCDGAGSTLAVDARRETSPVIRIEDCTLAAGGVRIATGKTSCDVDFVGVHVDDHVNVKTGGSTPGTAGNSIKFVNSVTNGKLVVRGKGSHEIFVGDVSIVSEGIDVRLKKGLLDVVGISNDVEVDSGGVRVQSTATVAAQFRLEDVGIAAGRLFVKTGGGDDQVLLLSSAIDDGDVVAKLGDGDDLLRLMTLVIGGDASVDGGPGANTLESADFDEELVDGDVSTRRFD